MIRIAVLAIAVLLAGLALGGLARRGVLPGGAGPRPVAVAVPETTIAVTWSGETLDPDRLRVPRDVRLTLRVTSSASRFANLELPGYGADGLRVGVVPGSERTLTFVTDRPGEGFEMVLGGRPVGRLDVTGDHLEEDRR